MAADDEVRRSRSPAPAAGRWADLAALLALAALVLLFFWKIALTNQVLAGVDILGYFYPYREAVAEAQRAGRLPLWNPSLFMGAPLLANSQAAALYPLHWPLIWLAAPKQVAWSIVLHIWLAAAGAYLLARRALRLSPLAALLAAAVWGLGGFLGAQVEHINQLNASAWLPWLLLALDGALAAGRRRWPALLAAAGVVALALLAGHTQAAYIVFFGAGVYSLLRGWQALKNPSLRVSHGGTRHSADKKSSLRVNQGAPRRSKSRKLSLRVIHDTRCHSAHKKLSLRGDRLRAPKQSPRVPSRRLLRAQTTRPRNDDSFFVGAGLPAPKQSPRLPSQRLLRRFTPRNDGSLLAVLRRFAPRRDGGFLAALRGAGLLLVAVLLGALLAAAQLLPTLELTGLSVRSGGLPYNEAASFSLKPGLVFQAFLPPYLWPPPFSEYVAYVGLAGLALAALGAWAVVRRRRPGGEILILAGLGLFLALGAYNPVYYLLYKLVPGFALFRAPARWLLLYSLGAALLAGIGLDSLPLLRGARFLPRKPASRERSPRHPKGTRVRGSEEHGTAISETAREQAGGRVRLTHAARPVLVLFLLLELFLAGRRLAYNHPTAPAAYDSLRTAPSHLLADRGGQPFRFLSLSDIRYDPGDMGDLQAMYAGCLSEQALYDLLVATKMKEVLAYNLPLAYGLSSVDGYDGGLLPLARYVTLERLFLDEAEIWPDGRLRQQLRQVPDARLLSLLNVKYVLTDKTQDAWIDGVFYDLEHTVPLGALAIEPPPAVDATHLGLASYLSGTAQVADGTPVAGLVVTATDGTTVSATLRAGEHTAEGRYTAGQVAHREARVVHRWRDEAGGSDYLGLFDLGGQVRPAAITIHSLLPGQAVYLRGLTLIDQESGTGRSVDIHPAYRLVHSGDVKIYQNRQVLPRALVVHRARLVPDDEAALALLRDPAFDPAAEVLLAGGRELAGPPPALPPEVEIVAYAPEEVLISARLAAPGYLLLTDADYPGWRAEVDGRPAIIERADVYFRAVYLESGTHQVTFRYEPASVRLGLALSLAGLAAWLLALALALWRAARRPAPAPAG